MGWIKDGLKFFFRQFGSLGNGLDAFARRPPWRRIGKAARFLMSAAVVLATALAILAAALRSNGFHETKWIFFMSMLVIGLIHLMYWGLLAADTVFSKSEDDLEIRNLLFPLLLLIAYFLAILNEKSLWVPSFCFMVVYLLLFIDEVGEDIRAEKRSYRSPNESNRAFSWMIMDWFLIIVLVGNIIEKQLVIVTFQPAPSIWGAKIYPLLRPYVQAVYNAVSVKDVIIFLNLFAYIIFYISARRKDQRSENLAYKEFVQLVTTYKNISSDGHDISPTINHLFAQQDGLFQVVDYGCANSRRTLDTLGIMGIQLSNIFLCGIDRDEMWKEDFDKACKSREVTNNFFAENFTEADAYIRKANIVIASHMIHASSSAKDFSSLIKNAPSNVVIIVIGCAQGSFLSGLINEAAVQGIVTQTYYRWDGRHLGLLIADAKLKNAAGSNSTVSRLNPHKPVFLPFARIKRRLKIMDDTPNFLASWVELKYGYRIGLRTYKMLYRQMVQANSRDEFKRLNFDDLVYVFTKA
ncbi:MAG TPA: hypothetical protein VFE58_14010 [Tepidisphaeraceae bacterium]|jgi:hypothetical protein|nr:hypothetical protein [Tepidisphaeraceae bacterium]